MVKFIRGALEEQGFGGFVRLKGADDGEAPIAAGVYVVYRPAIADPVFLAVSGAGRFKGRDPSVSASVLKGKWVPGARVVYIGKASLRKGGRMMVGGPGPERPGPPLRRMPLATSWPSSREMRTGQGRSAARSSRDRAAGCRAARRTAREPSRGIGLFLRYRQSLHSRDATALRGHFDRLCLI